MRGIDFEDWLANHIGGQARVIKRGQYGSREFDAVTDKLFVEAKTRWHKIEPEGKEFSRFQSNAGAERQIAIEHGATFEIHSNVPILQHVKTWLNRQNTPYVEH